MKTLLNITSLAHMLLVFHLTTLAQPATDIWLFDLTSEDGKMVVKNPVNITPHKGYDNQPFFHPDKPILYYTSADDQGRTDIIEYNLDKNQSRKLTNTPEKEYSPTVTPDKNFISCILQRENGAQDLVKYPVGGGKPVVLINELTVGYHAWLDDNNVFVFTLGDTVTLRLYTLRPKRHVILAHNIGRSLHRIPGKNSISFVHKLSIDSWLIKRVKENGGIEVITDTLPDKEDLTWTPDGKILMSDGEKLFFFEPGKSAAWHEVEIQSDQSAKGITRLAVNPAGNKIAVVVNEEE